MSELSNIECISPKKVPSDGNLGCECGAKATKLSDTDKVEEMFNTMLRSRRGTKARIKIEIELDGC